MPNGWVFMPLEPTPSPYWPEPQDDEPQWEDEFWDPAEIWDPDEIDAFIAEADQAAADQAAAQAHIAAMGQTSAMAAVAAGRRGPGQKGPPAFSLGSATVPAAASPPVRPSTSPPAARSL
jgi:hypothetical protein